MEHHGLVGTAGKAEILLRNNQMTKQKIVHVKTWKVEQPVREIHLEVRKVEQPVLYVQVDEVTGVAEITSKPQC